MDALELEKHLNGYGTFQEVYDHLAGEHDVTDPYQYFGWYDGYATKSDMDHAHAYIHEVDAMEDK